MATTRERVFRQAVRDHENVGKILWEPTSVPHTINTANGPIYNFGIRWNSSPESTWIVTYGPRVDFPGGWRGPAVPTNDGTYVCYAS